MLNINYLTGNITKPIHKKTVIAHIVNDIGKMGSGVAKALYERWPLVKYQYLKWFEESKDGFGGWEPFELGYVELVQVDPKKDIIVANMIAQHSIKSMGEVKPIRYDALDKCLKDVNEYCLEYDMILSMPKIGTDRAGGDWEIIKDIIRKNMLVETFVYIL